MSQSEDADDSASDQVLAVVTSAVSGIPVPIQRSAVKAFTRLFSALVEIPAGSLENIAAERRALSEARIQAIKAAGASIASRIDVDKNYSVTAGRKFAEKIVGRQKNVDEVVKVAAEQLILEAQHQRPSAVAMGARVAESKESYTEVSDDWLNSFEREAELANGTELRNRLGKILAGEIQTPASFSVRAVQTLARMDQRTALAFQRLCSLSMALILPFPIPQFEVQDARVCSLGGSAGSNSLQAFGLGFDTLNDLNENGLVISDYNSFMDYQGAIPLQNVVQMPLEYSGKYWALAESGGGRTARSCRIHGVRFSRVGQELRGIVDRTEDEKYTQQLGEFFRAKGLSMVEVGFPGPSQ